MVNVDFRGIRSQEEQKLRIFFFFNQKGTFENARMDGQPTKI